MAHHGVHRRSGGLDLNVVTLFLVMMRPLGHVPSVNLVKLQPNHYREVICGPELQLGTSPMP